MTQNNAAHISALEDLRLGVELDRHHLDDGDAKLAALDAALALLSKLRAPVADERASEHIETLRRMRADYKPSNGPISTLKAAALDAALFALASAPVAKPWQELAATVYQACGGYDMPARVLDLLSAAANGQDFAHLIDGVLPCCAPAAGEAKNYPGDHVAERLDNMADDQPPGSQAQSDLYAAATIWRKHIVHRAAPQASEAVGDADVSALLAFMFERFGQPGDAGELPDSVVAAVRRLERAALSAQPGAQKEQSDA